MSSRVSRRLFCKITAGGTLFTLSGCNSVESSFSGIDMTTTGGVGASIRRPPISVDPNIRSPDIMYAAVQDGEFAIPEVPHQKLDKRHLRQRVRNPTGFPAGTIVVDTAKRYAYYVTSVDEAVRYGVGIGKEGFEWHGGAVVGRKAKWPVWTPPAEMVARQPELAAHTGGMPAGLDNPLGARALYLVSNGKDTLYRLHGTPEWWTIGDAMSSGCIRFMNQDIIDLYDRAHKGTPVVVLA
ncbi:MAG: L,D-transpeptidase [Pseudomonadota bacterium]